MDYPTYTIDDLPLVIPIDVQTSAGVKEIRFDCASWLRQWPDMDITVWPTRPGENAAYPAETSMDGSVVVWKVSGYDTEIAGSGTVEILGLTPDGKRKPSGSCATAIRNTTLANTKKPGEADPPWVDKVLEAAERAAGYYTPEVDDDGWLTWVPSKEAMPAIGAVNIKGPQGDPGTGGTVEVDATLSVSGKAADAAATGAELKRVSEEIAFDFANCGLPVLYLTGDTTGMTKDDAVDMAYVYGNLSGTASVKWQGSSSINYPKKNYTVKFDQAFEAKEGWGEQKKYCLKANWMDASHARNLIGARLWGKMCAAHSVVDTDLQACPNWGAVDGFPVVIAMDGKFHGLYTFNVPKDGWMLGMGSGTREAILCADSGEGACRFEAPVTLDGDFDVEYASDENDTDWIIESLNRLINACINSDGSDIDTVIANYVDIDSAMDYMIHVCVTANPDNYDRNYNLSTKDGVKWRFNAYDMDMGFGINWSGDGFKAADDYPFFKDFANFHRLMYLLCTYKADAVKERYRALRGGVLSEIQIAKMVLDYASEIPLYVRNAEATRWPTVPASGANTVYQIIEYLRLRYPKLDAEVEAMVQQSSVPAPVLMPMASWYNEGSAGAAQDTITSVAFVPTYTATGDEDASWACDVGGNGSIMAYRKGTAVTVAPTNGATRICLNASATHMFANAGSAEYGNFANLSEITGTEMFVANSGTNASEICRKNKKITKPIYIPEGVTNIRYAYGECTALVEKPVLPEGLLYMEYAFQGCTALSELPTIPSTVSDLGGSFFGCSGVTALNGYIVPESVTDMEGTFMGCNNASGTVTVNAQNLTVYANAFKNAALNGNQIVLSGSCPLLAELAATKDGGNVVVAN